MPGMIEIPEVAAKGRGWRGLRPWLHQGIRVPAEVDSVLQSVVAAMTAEDYPARDLFAVRLVLEEALVNAIRHGHGGDPAREVRVRCWGSADEVVALVQDQGPGFNTGDVPDPLSPENLDRPSGRGLLLMRAYATFLAFNARGNGLIFRRRRSAE
jgi:serine/threonine-protein kinase RsbW